jgi:hypothetical protein
MEDGTMKSVVFAAAAAALLLTAGAASASEPCLQRDHIDGWGARDAHSLIVNDRFGKKYLLSVSGWCQDLDFSLGLGIHSFGGNGMSCLSRGDWIVPHGGATPPMRGTRCTITKIEAYTPEMEKADREAKAAKKE